MKRYRLILAALVSVFVLSACQDALEKPVDDASASVKVDEMVTIDKQVVNVKAGNFITFLFAGNPDFISFYTGEKGSEFVKKDDADAPAKGYSIKNITTSIDHISYAYAKVGVYVATFVFTNNRNGFDEVKTQNIVINVTE